MGLTRKQSLKVLNGLVRRVERHLAKLAEKPNAESAAHWRAELRTWLDQMTDKLPHIGDKTAAIWSARIEQWCKQLHIWEQADESND
jgi:hypothetical protein